MSLLPHMRILGDTLVCMRTTVEFDPDVAAELRQRRRQGRATLREDVSRLVRLGLAHEREHTGANHGPFSTPTFDSGQPLMAIDDIEAALARIEGDDHPLRHRDG